MTKKPLPLGSYQNFPASIHWTETYTSALSSRNLQEKIIRLLCELNRREFTFEQVSNPTIPNGRVIFEFGLADSQSFNYIDKEEVKSVLNLLAKTRLQKMDFFCGIRYHKVDGEKKIPLKSDYYLLRAVFGQTLEIQLFHERGPRYLSPQDIAELLYNQINGDSSPKILQRTGEI